ncbi:hypothetical protein B484DRAFT_449457 [Ochromonadaceae sp. CCMP2298]|nr:hypothetical protein B484DRAFT_449457 [Ochromonadaceae sp. CCMP2298]
MADRGAAKCSSTSYSPVPPDDAATVALVASVSDVIWMCSCRSKGPLPNLTSASSRPESPISPTPSSPSTPDVPSTLHCAVKGRLFSNKACSSGSSAVNRATVSTTAHTELRRMARVMNLSDFSIPDLSSDLSLSDPALAGPMLPAQSLTNTMSSSRVP